MINWLKKYFIPHEHNDYKPHILRREATLLILGIIFVVEFLFLIQVFVLFPKIKFFAEILENTLIQETNFNRLADNLPDLKINLLLTQAAQKKANDMATNSYFAHVSPQGITPWYWIDKVGYKYSYAGENLAINFSDSQDVVNAWMNSETHKANILSNNFTDIGIGIAKGMYQDKETIFIVQMFGRPALSRAEGPVAMETAGSSQTLETPAVIPIKIENVKAETNSIVAIAVSPSARTKYIYFIILGVVFLALMFSVLIKIKIQHPRIIINALFLIIIINSVLLLNQYLININGKIF